MKKINKRKDRAQSILTFAVILAMAVLALVTMRTYFTRAVQERYRQSADALGEGDQFEKNRTLEMYSGNTWKNEKINCPQIITKAKSLEETIIVLKHRAEALKKDAKNLEGRAKKLDDRVKAINIEIKALEAKGLSTEAGELKKLVASFEQESQRLKKEAQKMKDKADACSKEQEAVQCKLVSLKSSNPKCFK